MRSSPPISTTPTRFQRGLERLHTGWNSLSLTESIQFFTLACLSQALPLAIAPQPLPPMLSDDFELLTKPLDILELRYSSNGHAEVLVSWKWLPPCNNSQKCVASLLTTFLNLHIEDKMKALGGSIDRNRPIIKRDFVRRGQGNDGMGQGSEEAHCADQEISQWLQTDQLVKQEIQGKGELVEQSRIVGRREGEWTLEYPSQPIVSFLRSLATLVRDSSINTILYLSYQSSFTYILP